MALHSRNSSQRRKMRQYLRQRDGDNCWLCGKPMCFDSDPGTDPQAATMEHVIPAARGGNDTRSNLKLTHALCNKRRGAEDARTTLYGPYDVQRWEDDGGAIGRPQPTTA